MGTPKNWGTPKKCHFLAKKVEIRVFGGSKMTHFLAKKWSKNGSFLTSFLNRSPAKIAVKRPMFLSVCVQKVNQKWSKKWTKNWPKKGQKTWFLKRSKMRKTEKSDKKCQGSGIIENAFFAFFWPFLVQKNGVKFARHAGKDFQNGSFWSFLGYPQNDRKIGLF